MHAKHHMSSVKTRY